MADSALKPLRTETILGIDVSVVDPPGVVARLAPLLLRPRVALVNNVNIRACNLACDDAGFRRILNGSEIVFCDGHGVKLGARILGKRLGARMTPPDWIDLLFAEGARRGWTFFFVGDEAAVAEAFAAEAKRRHPGLAVAGTHHGFFEPGGPEDRALADRLRASRPDIILTAMGMPRQEYWAESMRGRLDRGAIVATGALFRWYAGIERRAPAWMSRRGMEWLHRLATRPVRNFRRYVLGIPAFYLRIAREWFSASPPSAGAAPPGAELAPSAPSSRSGLRVARRDNRRVAAVRRMLSLAVLALGVMAFLRLTVPANHTEAEDAWHYARMVESGAGAEMFHAHHLLYLPVARGLFRAAQVLVGYQGRAYGVLAGLSMAAGTAAIALLASFLWPPGRPARGHRAATLAAAAVLCATYGFWRYGVEAEIVAPALVLGLGAVACARRGAKPGWSAAAALLAAVAVLVHAMNVVVAFAAIPALYLAQGARRRALGHLLTVATVALAAYAAVAATTGWVRYREEGPAFEGGIRPSAVPKAVVAAGQAVVAGNFLFASPPLARRIERAFPYRAMDEEIFMGRMAPAGTAAIPWFTLAAVAVASLALIRALRRSRVFRWPGSAGAVSADGWAAGVWMAGAAAVAFLFEPGNPEMWVGALAPAAWLLGRAAVRAAGDADARRAGRATVATAALAAALAVHNWFGGLRPLQDEAGDYCARKMRWLSVPARAGDVVITADNHVFVSCLRYALPVRVLAVRNASREDVEAQLRDRPMPPDAQVWVFSDVFDPPSSLLYRRPDARERLCEIGDWLEPGLVLMHPDCLGGVYRWTRVEE